MNCSEDYYFKATEALQTFNVSSKIRVRKIVITSLDSEEEANPGTGLAKTNCVIEAVTNYLQLIKKDTKLIDEIRTRLVRELKPTIQGMLALDLRLTVTILKDEFDIYFSVPQSLDNHDFENLLKDKVCPFLDTIQNSETPHIKLDHYVVVLALLNNNVYFYSDGKPEHLQLNEYLNMRRQTIILAEETLNDLLAMRTAIRNGKGTYISVPGSEFVDEALERDFHVRRNEGGKLFGFLRRLG